MNQTNTMDPTNSDVCFDAPQENPTIDENKESPDLLRLQDMPLISDHAYADCIFTALGVSPDQDQNLRIVDEKENLVLIHYIEPNKDVFSVRGVVVDVIKGCIACQSFPFTKEYLPTDARLDYYSFENATMTMAYEGTILRVYFAQGKWRISTHRKIDASDSRWSGNAFQDTFYKAWGDVEFDEVLSRNCCYVFLLCDPANRIVCNIPELALYHVGTFTDGQRNRLYFSGVMDPRFAVKNPRVKTSDLVKMTKSEVCDYLSRENRVFVKKATGILVTTENGKVFKIVPPCYLSLRKLRGNVPSFEKRLVGIWKDEKRHTYDPETFLKPMDTAPEFVELFSEQKNLEELLKLLEDTIPVSLADDFEYRYAAGYRLHLEQPIHILLEKVHKFYRYDLGDIESNVRYQMSRLNMRTLFQIIDLFRD